LERLPVGAQESLQPEVRRPEIERPRIGEVV
jgi:hypothetical protein